jgi:integrase
MPRNKNTRAAHGTGTIRKKIVNRKGKEYVYWEARYTVGVDPGTGKQKQKSITGKTQKEVAAKLKEVTHAIDKGVYTEPQRLTYSDWLEIWISEYSTQSCKPITISTYQGQIDKHIKPALGNVKLTSLNTMQIQKLLNDLSRNKNLSPKSVKNVHGIIHKSLSQAVKLHYIPYNPTDACELPRMKQKEIRPLTEDEVKGFLAEIEKGEQFARLFKVALFTGMREGEICGLSWNAVDFKKGTITVKQQLQKEKEKGGSFYIATTKNDKARTITAAPFVMKILREERAEQAKLRFEMGISWKNDWNLVFTYPDGSHTIPRTVLKHFKAVMAKLGRPDARFHDLRHTYAVMSLQEGDDPKTVQENLGHATASFTLDVYGHVSEKMKQDSAARMENYIAKIRA